MNKSEADCNLCLNELLSGKYFNWRSVDVPMTNRDGAFFSACSFCPFEYAQDVVIPEGKNISIIITSVFSHKEG